MIFPEPEPVGHQKSRRPIIYNVDKNGCWICISHKLNDGYPQVKRNRKLQVMSRYIYELMAGEIISPEKVIMHSCDNPQCINPKHLIKGTVQDNIHDCRDKLRGYIGELNSQAKLTETQAIRICSFLEKGLSLNEIAKLEKTTKYSVSNIRRRKTWTHISVQYTW